VIAGSETAVASNVTSTLSTTITQASISRLLNFSENTTHSSPVRVYSSFFGTVLTRDYDTLAAMRCDEDGRFLASDVPPPPPEVLPTTDWFPFESRVGFELANFIFTEAELSKKKTNHLLELWAATLIHHGIPPPIQDHTDLLRQIDSIPLGNVPWECFCLQYDGPLPETNRPPEWMITEYDVWFRNPREVIKGILANPEFDGHVDYSAYQEFENSQRRYSNMMSGDWAWRQSVSQTASRNSLLLTNSDAGRNFKGSFNTWLNVCADHSWIGQNNGLRHDRSKRILSTLPLDRQCAEPHEKSAQERPRRHRFPPYPKR
jgi:hypothetical protein